MSDAPQTFVVDGESHRLRLDRFVAKVRPDLGRHAIARLLRTGGVTAGGRARDARHFVRRGETVTLQTQPILPTEPPRVLSRSPHAVALAKPPFVSTNPTSSPGGSLLDWVAGHLAGSADHPPGVVHRLDRETSGLVLFSLSPFGHRLLLDAFRERVLRKTYVALVGGALRPRHGVIDRPLAGRGGRSIPDDTGGSPARTDYRSLIATRRWSLLAVRPITGRTHQIRVHLAAVGHPIAGDPSYGDPRHAALGAPRLWLHASRIDLDEDLARALALPSRLLCPLWDDLARHLARLAPGYEARNT